jgi:hypothetical protein
MDRYASAEDMRKDIEKILKNPSMLERKGGFLYNLFHPHSPDNEAKKAERTQKKALKKAAKEAKKEKEQSHV